MRWARGSSGRRREKGAAAVEFAIISSLVLMLMFAIIQYGMYFFAAQTGTAAAREAVRRAAVGACDDAQLKTFVFNRVNTGALDGSAADLTVGRTFFKADGVTSVPPPGVVGGTVKVHVSFPTFNGHFPFVPFLSSPRVDRTVDARLENTANPGAC